MDEPSDRQIERALREKANAGRNSQITGLKLMVFGVHLTLFGGIVEWGVPVLSGGVIGLLGLFVR